VSAGDGRSGGPLAGPSPSGVAFALAAYGAWGVVPLFWKLLGRLPAIELLAHRVVWSLVLIAVLLPLFGGFGPVRAALSSARHLRWMIVSGLLIAVNWGLFIWAVGAGRLLDASFGYFINPLANVALGVLVLKERLRTAQRVAVGLAGAAVAFLLVLGGSVPWVALTLAASFAAYGLCRKLAPIESMAGLFVETVLLAPPALAYLVWLERSGEGVIARGDIGLAGLVALVGPVTALPLVWFAAAARRLPLSTLGLFQYVAPTCQFLLAVLAFGEPMAPVRWAAFFVIWAALGVHTWDLLSARRSLVKSPAA
jgi:chloramphenicol-sensitive protein RarD